jgi:hypothetical protein
MTEFATDELRRFESGDVLTADDLNRLIEALQMLDRRLVELEDWRAKCVRARPY